MQMQKLSAYFQKRSFSSLTPCIFRLPPYKQSRPRNTSLRNATAKIPLQQETQNHREIYFGRDSWRASGPTATQSKANFKAKW